MNLQFYSFTSYNFTRCLEFKKKRKEDTGEHPIKVHLSIMKIGGKRKKIFLL